MTVCLLTPDEAKALQELPRVVAQLSALLTLPLGRDVASVAKADATPSEDAARAPTEAIEHKPSLGRGPGRPPGSPNKKTLAAAAAAAPASNPTEPTTAPEVVRIEKKEVLAGPGASTPPPAAPVEEKAPAPAADIDLATMRAPAVALSKITGSNALVGTLISQFGGQSLATIPQEKRQAFLDAVAEETAKSSVPGVQD